MKQNICELDTMIFFREALEAHEFMLLPVMASAVVECRTADKELKTLNEDGEIGLARLFSIWANMMCAPGAATIVGCRPITMLSEILAQVHAYLTVHPLYDPEGLALYVELHHMMDAILKDELQKVIALLESGETDTEVVQETLDEAVCGINDLQEEFDENDSEIETVARECIAATVAYILEWFGIPIDTEEAIRERDW